MAQETLLEAVSAAMYAGRAFGEHVRNHTAAVLAAGSPGTRDVRLICCCGR